MYAAAAAACMQEASLYLPYPLELLRFPSFGVQLDAAGRLVFRGPRWAAEQCMLPQQECHVRHATKGTQACTRRARCLAGSPLLLQLLPALLQHAQLMLRLLLLLLQVQDGSRRGSANVHPA
jgi:hypothetical protein